MKNIKFNLNSWNSIIKKVTLKIKNNIQLTQKVFNNSNKLLDREMQRTTIVTAQW